MVDADEEGGISDLDEAARLQLPMDGRGVRHEQIEVAELPAASRVKQANLRPLEQDHRAARTLADAVEDGSDRRTCRR